MNSTDLNPYARFLIEVALEENIHPQRFIAFAKEVLWANYNNSRRTDTKAAELHNNPEQLQAMQSAYQSAYEKLAAKK